MPLPKPDWKWEDFLAAAKALTKDNDGDGRIDIYGLGFEPTLIRVAPFVWQAGGDIVDDVHRPTRFTLDESSALAALDFIRSWYVRTKWCRRWRRTNPKTTSHGSPAAASA